MPRANDGDAGRGGITPPITRETTEPFAVERPVDDALMVARRATFDPGKFTKRVLYCEGELETLERWQARAVLVALAALEPDDRWAHGNARGSHITDYEREEMTRLGLGGRDGV